MPIIKAICQSRCWKSQTRFCWSQKKILKRVKSYKYDSKFSTKKYE